MKLLFDTVWNAGGNHLGCGGGVGGRDRWVREGETENANLIPNFREKKCVAPYTYAVRGVW